MGFSDDPKLYRESIMSEIESTKKVLELQKLQTEYLQTKESLKELTQKLQKEENTEFVHLAEKPSNPNQGNYSLDFLKKEENTKAQEIKQDILLESDLDIKKAIKEIKKYDPLMIGTLVGVVVLVVSLVVKNFV